MTSSIDPLRIQVDLLISDELLPLLKTCHQLPQCPDQLKNNLQTIIRRKTDVPFPIVYQCHQLALKYAAIKPPPLWKLYRSTTIALPSPKVKNREPVNPEVKHRTDVLRQQAANRAYNQMLNGVVGPRIESHLTDDDKVKVRNGGRNGFGCEFKQMRRQLFMILNFCLVVLAGFAAGFYLPVVFYSGTVAFRTRLIWGYAVGMLVFFADLYFLLKNMDYIDRFIPN